MDDIESLNVINVSKCKPNQRFGHAKLSGPSFNCMQPFTRNHTCSKQVCRQCQERHHTLQHIDMKIQNINDRV